jgi:hypothetical protein
MRESTCPTDSKSLLGMVSSCGSHLQICVDGYDSKLACKMHLCMAEKGTHCNLVTQAIGRIAAEERAKLFVPVSIAQFSVYEALAADLLSRYSLCGSSTDCILMLLPRTCLEISCDSLLTAALYDVHLGRCI